MARRDKLLAAEGAVRAAIDEVDGAGRFREPLREMPGGRDALDLVT